MKIEGDGDKLVLTVNSQEAMLLRESCTMWLDATVTWTPHEEKRIVENLELELTMALKAQEE